jgi:hypothetical protein
MGVFDEIAKGSFTTYEVELTFEEKIMGGVPRDPKVIEGWIKSKAGVTDEHELRVMIARTMDENGSMNDVLDTAQALEEKDPDEIYALIAAASDGMASQQHLNGFKQDENGLYIEDRQIKAMLKESTNILFAGDRWGKTKKGPRSFVAERAFVRPSHISLGRTEPDGIDLVVGHVSDKAGKRSTLTYHEYVMQPVIRFRLEILRDELTLDQWGVIFDHAQRNGLGALRSQSHGRFEVTDWQKIK